MSAADWMVVVAGAAGIAWVHWYFFRAARASTTATLAAGAQEVTIGVRGGYDPAQVRVKRGVPVRLTFDRRETAGCSEEVVFPDFGVRRFLPANARTTVEITPAAAGSFDFTCGMGMLRGKLIVEE